MSNFKPKNPPDHPRAWVDEIAREIALRRGVYSKRVTAGTMSPEESAYRIAAMENVLAFVQNMHSSAAASAVLLLAGDGTPMHLSAPIIADPSMLDRDEWRHRERLNVVDARGLARFQRMHDQAAEKSAPISRSDVLPSEIQ